MTKKERTLVIVDLIVVLILVSCGLNGCRESDRVNYNIRREADNFDVRRRVIALNTRTNEALFEVEGMISISSDTDGDLNVTIKTGEDSYQLFYAHLSDDVTYTSVQLDESDVNPYAYEIMFFPPTTALQNGLTDVKLTD